MGGGSRGRGSGQQWSRGNFVTLVGKRTNSRFVGWGRGHVVVSSGQHADLDGKWTNGR